MAKKPRISFEDMTTIHDQWMANPTGTQAGIFKEYGWTRDAYFEESYYRQFPEERPVENPPKRKM